MAAGSLRVHGAGVGALGTKHLRSGAGRQLLCNLSPSRTGAASLRRRLGLQLGRRGRRERPKEVVLGPGTCGGPLAPALAPLAPLRWEAQAGLPLPRGGERRGSPGARGAASCLERCLREQLCGGGGWGGRGFGPMESWSQPIPCGGFPALAAGACFLGFPPLISPCFPSPFPLYPPPQPSSRLLQCGGCGYLVNCNCGPLQWERSFLLGFYIYADPEFSRVFASSCSSGSKLEGDCCRTHRMIKKTCAINYSWRLG